MNCLSRDEIHPHLQRNPNSPISVMKKQNKANERNTTMKKLFAILLASVMVCALCVTAFAAPAGLSGHTYTAYQIFTGTQGDSADLAAIEWGSNISSAAFLSALQSSTDFGASNPFAACATADDVASVLKDWSDNSANAKVFAKIALDNITGTGIAVVNGATTLEAGYYLVVDTTEDAEVYNLALLQLTKKGTFTIANKVDVPEVTKKVSDASALICTETAANHVHGKACYTWSDANKVAIGDTVLFSISSAVPAAAADYDYYYFIIGDTLADGLTYTTGSIAVTIGGASAVEGSDYSVKFGADGKTFELALHDAKTNAGKTVDVLYAATLNETAVIGTAGNRNEVSVTFSSNPNFKYYGTKNPTTPYTPGEDGAPEDSEKPGFPAPQDPGSTTDIPTDETPKDITLTYTTALKIYKVDQDSAPLSDVEFTLNGTASSTNVDGIVSFDGLNAGEYILTETGTPDGYNSIDPINFEITCELPATVADGTETCTWTVDTDADIEYNAASNAFEITVVNQKGSVLPETGGIGTTIFYVLGGLLAAGAIILLVVKKRMSEED